jgi:hypothetical protein
MSAILAMPQQPAGLEESIRAIVMPHGTEHMLAAAERLAREVRGVLRSAQASISEPENAQDVFRDFYYYVFEYTNKVLSACERRDAIAAGSAASHMQEQICQLMNKVDNGFYGEDFNLLGEYSAGYYEAGFPDLLDPATRGDLDALAKRVQQLDEMMREWLGMRSISLNVLESEEELRHFLNQRDPA